MASLLALMGTLAIAAPSALPAAPPSVPEPPLINAAASAVQGVSDDVQTSANSVILPDTITALTEIWQIRGNFQVRIEQRLIIRVPRTSVQPTGTVVDDLPATPLARNYTERRMGSCLPMAGIAGVQISRDDRLMLFMRDRRIISAELERACRARDFYSGFYLERSEDGQLCVDRDELHSRAGAKCEIERLRQLIPED